MSLNLKNSLAMLVSVVAITITASAAQADGEVNIYSSRHYDTDERLYSDFTKATGIKVNRIEGNINELIERVETMISKAIGRKKNLDGVVLRAARNATGTARINEMIVPRVAMFSVSQIGLPS